MSNLLKLQFRNVLHNKLIYICLGVNLLLGPILSFILELTVKTPELGSHELLPEIMSSLAEPGIVAIMFIAIFTCLDFNEGTMKNIIARGYTRTQVLFSKYIVSIVSVAAMMLVSILLSIIFFAHNGLGTVPEVGPKIIISLLSFVCNTIFYVTLSFALEKNSSAIVGCMFIPRVIGMVLPLISKQSGVPISDYWIDGILTAFNANPGVTSMILPAILLIAYSVGFVLLGTQICCKKEIK